MTSNISFQQQQRAFVQYLRQPVTTPLPDGFVPERLSIYVKLLYNKFDECLSACFPIIRSLTTAGDWRALLLDFIAEYRCTTPYYRRIPAEFVHYLQHERLNPNDKPFIAELAHYEWLELELSTIEAEPITHKALTPAQLLDGCPVFVPVRMLLHYYWPVQTIGADNQPAAPADQPYYILAFRDINDDVRFIALNPITAQLVSLLQSGLSGRQALDRLGASLDRTALHPFGQFGLDTIAELHRQGAIVDVSPAMSNGERK
ncbi:MAG: HvfC family RiPP maturation protein [Gammaproteobacteria bacterium]